MQQIRLLSRTTFQNTPTNWNYVGECNQKMWYPRLSFAPNLLCFKREVPLKIYLSSHKFILVNGRQRDESTKYQQTKLCPKYNLLVYKIVARVSCTVSETLLNYSVRLFDILIYTQRSICIRVNLFPLIYFRKNKEKKSIFNYERYCIFYLIESKDPCKYLFCVHRLK